MDRKQEILKPIKTTTMTIEEMRQELLKYLGSTNIVGILTEEGVTKVYNSIKKTKAAAIKEAFEAFAEFMSKDISEEYRYEAKELEKTSIDQFLKNYLK